MKITAVITKNIYSVKILEDMVRSHTKIDNILVYSKNINIEAQYQVNIIIQAFKAEGINIIEQKPNYPYEHFKGAIIISNN